MANIIDTDSKIISTDQFGFGQPVLCRCSSTLMFAAHINDISKLEIHKSINDGVNWSLVKTFTETDPGDFEMCAIDSTSAAITFIYNTDDNILYVTTDSGSTWANKLVVASGTNCIKANITYDPVEGRLWSAIKISNEIQLNYSDNKGDSWTDVNSGAVGGGQMPDMDINPLNSKVYVVITDIGTSNCYRYIFSKTGVYESNSQYANANEFHDSGIVIDSLGNDWLITGLHSTQDGKYYIIPSKNGANILISNSILGPADSYSDLIIPGSLSCAVDGDDNIYAFYTKASDEKTYYRKYNGSTWESEVILVGIANDRISTEKRPIAGSNKLHYVYYKAP